MKINRLLTIFFLIIIAISLFTRLANLSSYPPALSSDEVDAGYQAMVFNAQGTDYYGNKLPIHFHSFSDWRTSATIYSTAILQKLHVSPELSVRLPSAIFGLISIYLLFLITGSPVAAFLLAISPWAIHYSRTGFEVSGMLMVLLAGLYLFQRFQKTLHPKYLIASLFFFCLSPYFYSTAKFLLPFIFLLLLIIWRHLFLKLTPRFLVAAFLAIVLFLSPMALDTLRGRSGFRFSYISIFTEPHREQTTDLLRYQDVLSGHPDEVGLKTSLLSSLLHNKYQLIAQRFFNNYFLSFDNSFLFLTGDGNIRQGFGQHGLLYLLDAIFIALGLIYYFRKPDTLGSFFLLLLLLAPIPFALTRDSTTGHATRLILMLPSLIYFCYRGIGKKYFVIPFYLLFFFTFWHYYTLHYPQAAAADWQSGKKEAVMAAHSFPNQKIYYSSTPETFISYFLFYNSYMPAAPLAQVITEVHTNSFDGSAIDNKYFFGHINWDAAPADPDEIFVLTQNEYKSLPHPTDFKVLKIIPKKYLSAPDYYFLTPSKNK